MKMFQKNKLSELEEFRMVRKKEAKKALEAARKPHQGQKEAARRVRQRSNRTY